MSTERFLDEPMIDEYERDNTTLRLTPRRLIVDASSSRLLGGRSSQTTLFLDQIDAIERDVEGHDGLAVLALGVFSLSWLSADDGKLPLLVIALALIVAYMMTRRASVVFRAGPSQASIEYSGEQDPELERFIGSVEQVRGQQR